MEYMENNNNKFLIVEAALKFFFFSKKKKNSGECPHFNEMCAICLAKGEKKNPIFKITHFD
jgi:hypothetical protein